MTPGYFWMTAAFRLSSDLQLLGKHGQRSFSTFFFLEYLALKVISGTRICTFTLNQSCLGQCFSKCFLHLGLDRQNFVVADLVLPEKFLSTDCFIQSSTILGEATNRRTTRIVKGSLLLNSNLWTASVNPYKTQIFLHSGVWGPMHFGYRLLRRKELSKLS